MSITAKALKNLKTQYLGANVIIYLKDMNVVTVNGDGEQMSISAMVQALIIDIDEDFFHTGLPDGTITRSIKHEIAGMIEISLSPDDEMMMLGEDMPTDESEVH